MPNSTPTGDISQTLEKAGHRGWALKLRTCGNPVRVLECAQCGWRSHPIKFHCKLRCCPHCMADRANALRSKYLDAVKQMRNPALWTLTLVDSNDLERDVDRIRAAFAKLRRRKLFRSILRGGLYCIEVTPGKTRRFRVHLHALVDSFYISQKRLSRIWYELTGDSYVVWVSRVRGNRGRALSYILKYVSKGLPIQAASWPAHFVVAVLEILNNTRLIQAVGSLFNTIPTLKRKLFCCPRCSADLWRVLDYLTGEALFDTVECLRFRAARGSPC